MNIKNKHHRLCKANISVVGQRFDSFKELVPVQIDVCSEMPTHAHENQMTRVEQSAFLFTGIFCSLEPPPFAEETNDKRLCW